VCKIVMSAKLSTEFELGSDSLKTNVAGAPLTIGGRILLLALNYIPGLHAAAVILLLVIPVANWWTRWAAALATLYLIPPISARTVRWLIPIAEGRIAFGSKMFFSWWILFQWQCLFNRFPALEEILRLVPGLYSCWLRLWGGKIGRLTFWAAGTLILDRSFVEIGNDVAFGAGVRINPHVLAKNENGQQELLLATVKISDRAMIGGYSLLTAGTEIVADEATRAFLVSPPFSIWKNGKRLREQK